MTRAQVIVIAAGGSAALLLGALGFQYLGGLAPCTLCIWQRWPHLAALVIGVLALRVRGPVLPVLGALAVLASAGIAGFHAGVEWGWWAGLASCSAGSIAGVSTADLLNPDVIVAAPVRCDAVAWAFAGLSMAGWNAVMSVGLALVWRAAARRPK